MSVSEALEQSKRELVRQPPHRVYHSIVAEPGSYQLDIAFVKYSHSKRYKEANDGMTCMLVAI